MNINKEVETCYMNKPNIDNLKGLSFRNYMRSELRRGYLLENDEERYTARREKVYTFFKIPREIEKFFVYGFFQCADSFLYVLTFLPIRFFLAIWSLLLRPIQQLLGWRVRGKLLRPAEIVDLLKGALLLIVCHLLSYMDTSVGYHIIKTQSTIKLYLFFNMLEIADRLMSAFGQDTLDALFWTATEPRGRKREHFGVLIHFGIAVIYVAMHSCIVLLQALCLNVAINSDNKGLLTIVISNNFVELKGAVFKKFDRNNLLQISCSDVRERFHNLVLLTVVVIQTMKEYSWREDRFWILLPDCALVCGTEVLIDWLKHAFITRFNDIPSDAYRDYTVILASDLITCKQKYAYSDHSDLVARRMGFIPIPLGVVTFRILSQSLKFTNVASVLLVIMGFFCLITFKVVVGIFILGKACDLISDAEQRTRTESSSEGNDKKISSDIPDVEKSVPNICSTKHKISNSEKDASCGEYQVETTRKRFLETPSNLEIPRSSNSTPDTLSPSSQSLGFLGESKRGLMANSMINLASFELNQNSTPSLLNGQDTGPPSPDGALLEVEPLPKLITTEHKSFTFVPEGNDRMEESKVKEEHFDDAKVENINEGGKVEVLNEDYVLEDPQPTPLSSRNKLYSCDSLRYRGTDDDIL